MCLTDSILKRREGWKIQLRLPVYNCLDPFEVYERIRKWVIRQRWYPRGLGDYTIIDAWRVTCSIYIGLLRVGGIRILLPVTITARPPPRNLPSERYARANGFYVYEAEYAPEYNELLWKSRIPGLQIEIYDKPNTGNTPVINGHVINSIEALSPESTNTLAKIILNDNQSYVLKSYRTLSKYNLEPLFLKYLSGKGIVPKLYSTVSIKDSYTAVLVEYLDVIGDGGFPFYQAIRASLAEKKVIVPEEAVSSLASSLTFFHEEMARCSSWWCTRGKITSSDIHKWTRRIKSYYNKALNNAQRHRSKCKQAISLLRESQYRVEEAFKLMKLFKGKTKIRNHQDLHLGQILYTNKYRYVIIDFEGEPGRSDLERLALEPALRDVACVMRSIGYITVFAYRDHFETTLDDSVERLFDEKDKEARIAVEWANKTAEQILDKYLEKTRGIGILIHGLGGDVLAEWGREVIKVWLIERALYEFLYELNYRTGYALIPLLGLTGILP